LLVHMDNCPESLIAWLGSGYAGVVPVTTNARSTLDELQYFAEHSRSVAAVTQPQFASLVAKAAPHIAWLAVTQYDADGGLVGSRPNGAEAFEGIDADPTLLSARVAEPMAPFAVQYTSGTTSRPKAVLWTHANALWGAKVSALCEGLGPDDVHLVTMPVFHTNAQVYSVLASIEAGATVVLQPRFSASRFWPVSLKHGCTWSSMVPFCPKALAAHPIPERHSYRLWGNAVCAPRTDQLFGVKTIGWWGMTETVTLSIVGSTVRDDEPLSMGRPSPCYEVCVLDETGQPTRPGEIGNLYIRGRRGVSLFMEYLDDPLATAAAFRDDGLFITGDRVRMGHDGALFFADRAKDILKVGGENVAASEIERVIVGVAGVSEAAVVGRRHPLLDEEPIAFVIPENSEDSSLTERIQAECRLRLATFKQPREIRLCSELPRSTLNKIAKAELRKRLAIEQ
jgi:crotonobetaine/carnitine-CoA ligase